jgi:hypothetical protein
MSSRRRNPKRPGRRLPDLTIMPEVLERATVVPLPGEAQRPAEGKAHSRPALARKLHPEGRHGTGTPRDLTPEELAQVREHSRSLLVRPAPKRDPEEAIAERWKRKGRDPAALDPKRLARG